MRAQGQCELAAARDERTRQCRIRMEGDNDVASRLCERAQQHRVWRAEKESSWRFEGRGATSRRERTQRRETSGGDAVVVFRQLVSSLQSRSSGFVAANDRDICHDLA